jgi:hypothetical protein
MEDSHFTKLSKGDCCMQQDSTPNCFSWRLEQAHWPAGNRTAMRLPAELAAVSQHALVSHSSLSG